jgi:hypothetical protein
MYLHRIFKNIRRLLRRRRALARCRVASRRLSRSLLFLVALSGARFATASVLISGDVTPVDNPFTLNLNEGLPSDGNFVNPFEAPNAQTFYEGRHLDNNVADPLDDNNVNIPEIVVGRSAFGALLISGESALRDQTLTIGGSGQRIVNGSPTGPVRPGTGVVRITGFGSLYNSDPTIVPPGLPNNFGSKTPRSLTGADGEGNDLYIGRAGTATQAATGPGGTGTLEISAGARAEIQDAVILGNDSGSTGNLIIDGFDSFFGSGGFESGVVSTGEPHSMIIGRQGVGFMTITNGATVQNDVNSGALGNEFIVAASIGSDPFQEGQVIDFPGGTGTVTVNGTASKWIVGGTLQVGGFTQGVDGATVDLEGDNTVYSSEAGRGTLYVQDAALVNVRSAIGVTDPSEDQLFLAIGRFGRVILSGGLINVGGGSTDDPRGDDIMVVNDGVIQGTGRIETGIFRNRYLGEVRVGPAEHLIIDSASDYSGAGAANPPLANWGVMQVFGTVDAKADLEFERALVDTQSLIQPFRNLRIPRPATALPGTFWGGLISAQHSILRFRSGLENTGMMAFTAGNNYVTGNVVNLPGPVAMPADGGVIIISGPGTKVTFENDLISAGGTITVTGGATLEILARHSFVTAGELKMTLDPQSSNQIFSAGDAGIAGKLTVSLSGFAPGSLNIGDSFQIISVSGQMGGVDFSNPNYPVPDLTAPPLFTQLSLPSLVPLGLPPNARLLPVYLPSSVMLAVVTLGTAIGPDFNGDGVVNNADLFIWLANAGITSGATVLQGDADGDGDVDGDDFLFWQRNYGKPMPWAGAGSGNSTPGAVPEPTGLALLAFTAMISLAFRSRRRVR